MGELVTSQQALDRQQDGADIEQGRPLVLQDVQADETLFIHIGVKTRRDKFHTGSLVRITSRKVQREPVPEAIIHLRERPTGQRDRLGGGCFLYNRKCSTMTSCIVLSGSVSLKDTVHDINNIIIYCLSECELTVP